MMVRRGGAPFASSCVRVAGTRRGRAVAFHRLRFRLGGRGARPRLRQVEHEGGAPSVSARLVHEHRAAVRVRRALHQRQLTASEAAERICENYQRAQILWERAALRSTYAEQAAASA